MRVFSCERHGYLSLHSASWQMSTHGERGLILAATSECGDGLMIGCSERTRLDEEAVFEL